MLALPDLHKSMGDILQKNASIFPNKIALWHGDQIVSYRELEKYSSLWARYFVEKGIKKGDRIVILAEKGISALIAIFGVLKSGGIYVPIDPDSPIERLRHILADIEPAMVIGPSNKMEVVSGLVEPVLIYPLEKLSPCSPETMLLASTTGSTASDTALPAIEDHDAAYCMYTSGSTGKPKGVVISHRSAIVFFQSVNEYVEINGDSKCINFAPLFFDASIVDTFLPLFFGASVYLYSGRMIPSTIWKIIEGHRITHFDAISSLLTMLVEGAKLDKYALSHVKVINTGAEIPNIRTIQTLLKKIPNLQIINGYGPTEVTCMCLAERIHKVEPERTELYPIGLPMSGIKAVLLDGHQQVIEAVNCEGELAVSGEQLMLGYWNQPQLTNSRLVTVGEDVYYCTGDICIRDSSGKFHFIGRKDDEVKIKGYRINLNEIREAAWKVGVINDSLIFVVDDELRGKSLAMAAVLNVPPTFGEGDSLKHELLKYVPEYMVPRYVLLCSNFPKLPSGKVDMQQLKSIVLKEKGMGEIFVRDTWG